MPLRTNCGALLNLYINFVMVYYQKFVAIKSLKNADFDGVLESFLEEAQTMQKLSHSNIVQMYGISLPFKDEPLKLVSINVDKLRASKSEPAD